MPRHLLWSFNVGSEGATFALERFATALRIDMHAADHCAKQSLARQFSLGTLSLSHYSLANSFEDPDFCMLGVTGTTVLDGNLNRIRPIVAIDSVD